MVAETYNDKVVRQLSIMTVVWGIVGMLAGVVIASQLVWPALNFDISWLTYGRLRPLHTNAAMLYSEPAKSGFFQTGLLPLYFGAGRWLLFWRLLLCL